MTDKPQIASIIIKPARAAKLLDCSKPYIYKLAKSGLLPTVSWELDGSKTVRFHIDDVLEFIDKHRS